MTGIISEDRGTPMKNRRHSLGKKIGFLDAYENMKSLFEAFHIEVMSFASFQKELAEA